MAYSTKADLLERISQQELIELSTSDPNASQEDDNKINRAIEDADEEIESYAAKRFDVPFSPVPKRIRTLSVDIALYNLYKGKPKTFDKEVIEGVYKSAVQWLRDLAAGKVTVGDLPEPAKSELTGGTVQTNDRVFTRDDMEGF